VYAALAVERGIAELAITDHIDFDPRWPNFGPDIRERERTVREAAERWGPRGVAIRFGLEVSYEIRREQEIREHLARHAYDFVIGSVHVTAESPYFVSSVAAWVEGKSLPAIVAPYFDEVEAAVRTGLFDALGHIDVVKRYVMPHVMPAAFAGAPELYEPILRALVDTGTALEVNTSGLRQRSRETYPPPAIVAMFRELGGERVTAGSDAHHANWFGLGLEEGYRAIADAGFEHLTFRRGRERVAIEMPDRARWT
jgi:histidinol-phosphatase (PHP family)